jgi:CHAT domain-containing protein
MRILNRLTNVGQWLGPFCLILCLIFSPLYSQTPDQAFEEAQGFFKSRKYEEATQRFRAAAEAFYPQFRTKPENEEQAKAAAWYVKSMTEAGRSLTQAGRLAAAIELLNQQSIIANLLLGNEGTTLARLYNSLAQAYEKNGQHNSAYDYYSKSLQLTQAALGNDHVNVAIGYFNLGIAADNSAHFAQALNYKKMALERYTQLKGANAVEVGETYNGIGVSYDNLGDYENAVLNYEKGLAILSTHYGDKDPALADIYNNIGIAYEYKGDPGTALRYKEKSLALREGLGSSDRGDRLKTAESYLNIGNTLAKKRDYSKALEYMNKALTTYQSSEDIAGQSAVQVSLGIIYVEAVDEKNQTLDLSGSGDALMEAKLKKARSYFQAAYQSLRELYGDRHPKVSQAANRLGNVYSKMGQLNDREGSRTYYPQALKYFQRALIFNTEQFSDSSLKANPAINQDILSRMVMLESLREKGKTLYNFAKTYRLGEPENVDILRTAQKTFKHAQQLVYLIRNELSNDRARLDYAEKLFEFYENAILTVLSLENAISLPHVTKLSYEKPGTYLKESFVYSEYSKASVMLAAFNESKDKKSIAFRSDVDDRELQRLNSSLDALKTNNAAPQASNPEFQQTQHALNALKARIIQHNKAILELEDYLNQEISLTRKQKEAELTKGARGNKDLIRQLRSKQLTLQQRQDSLADALRVSHSNYFTKSNQQIDVVSVDKIQDVLSSSRSKNREPRAFIEYFLSPKYLYIFYISDKQFKVDTVRNFNAEELGQLVKKFRKAVVDQQASSFSASAYPLYQQLFLPVQEFLNQDSVKRVTIVPDGLLTYIPMEALIDQAAQNDASSFAQLSYLLHRYEFTYSYSVTLYSKTTQKKRSNALIAFAPGFTSEDQNRLFGGKIAAPLPASEQEVKAIVSIAKQKNKDVAVAVLGQNANKASLDQLANFDLIHFATHGYIYPDSPDRSGILLYPEGDSKDGMLYNGEIGGLNLNARLITLSACETGLGEIKRGEGIINITRSFINAGAASVVVSLWSVADASTSVLMQDFYQYLLDNDGLAGGLTNAKRKMVRSGQYAAPFFWAPFIFVS